MLRDIVFYLLGGVTFLPLCLLSAFVLFSTPLEKNIAAPEKQAPLEPQVRQDAENTAAEHLAADQPSKTLATWLVVKQSADELPPKSSVCFGKDGKPKQWRSSDDDDKKSFGVLKGSRRERSAKSSPLVYDMAIPGNIEFADEPVDDGGIYYGILRAPVLYLYNSDNITRPGSECIAAIDLRQKRVSLWTRDAGSMNDSEQARQAPREGELFSKRNAIHVIGFGDAPDPARLGVESQWFLMAPRTSLQEDWYHALVSASLMAPGRTSNARPVDAVGDIFSTGDMRNMVSSLDNVPDPIPLRWLNAIMGRIFFSVYRTAALEQYLLRKWTEKIVRTGMPRFITDVHLSSFDMGRSPPTFSRPMLKTLTGDGHASMEVCIHYQGAMRSTMSAVVNISLGQRFKTYRVPIVLAVVLSELEGNILINIKPPPSNRLWWGFTTMPHMKIDIEPVVSERRVSWSFVNSLIRGRIRETIANTLVLPHMNDVPFFDTTNEARRGGIWRESGRSQPESSSAFRAPAQQVSTPLKSVSSHENLAQATSPRDDTPEVSRAAEGLSTLLRQSERDEQSPKSASSTRMRFSAFKESLQERRRSAASLRSRASDSPEKPASTGSDTNASLAGDPLSLSESATDDAASESSENTGTALSAESQPSHAPPPQHLADVVRTQQTTASLLSTWSQRARASMADRESRTETAREAKNAIKRGWSAWNNRGKAERQLPTRPAELPTSVLPKPELPSSPAKAPRHPLERHDIGAHVPSSTVLGSVPLKKSDAQERAKDLPSLPPRHPAAVPLTVDIDAVKATNPESEPAPAASSVADAEVPEQELDSFPNAVPDTAQDDMPETLNSDALSVATQAETVEPTVEETVPEAVPEATPEEEATAEAEADADTNATQGDAAPTAPVIDAEPRKIIASSEMAHEPVAPDNSADTGLLSTALDSGQEPGPPSTTPTTTTGEGLDTESTAADRHDE